MTKRDLVGVLRKAIEAGVHQIAGKSADYWIVDDPVITSDLNDPTKLHASVSVSVQGTIDFIPVTLVGVDLATPLPFTIDRHLRRPSVGKPTFADRMRAKRHAKVTGVHVVSGVE